MDRISSSQGREEPPFAATHSASAASTRARSAAETGASSGAETGSGGRRPAANGRAGVDPAGAVIKNGHRRGSQAKTLPPARGCSKHPRAISLPVGPFPTGTL